MITIITPIHKYEFLENALNNFICQNYKDKELLLILNGEIKKHINKDVKQIISTSNNIAELRNIGLDYCNKNNRSIFSFFDSDDFYQENYLTEAIEKLKEGYELVGKLDYQFKYNNDLYLVNGLIKGKEIHGPTMTGYLSDKRFDLRFNSLGEDIDFISRHKKIGYTSENNWIYNVIENSIQNRSFNTFIEGIKYYNENVLKNKECKIYKNGELYWKFGDGADGEKMFNNPQVDLSVFEYHKQLIKDLGF